MFVLKILLLFFIVISSSVLGILLSKRYFNREQEIKEMKNALNMFKTKIKFTYETIPNIFKEISTKINGNVGKIFEMSSNRMKEIPAGDAWIEALESIKCNLTKEDINILKNLGRMLRTN